MSQPPDLAAILAALGKGPNGTPAPSSSTPVPPVGGYPSAATPSNPLAGISLPQPTSSGNLDLSAIKPVNSGSVSLADAIAKARGIAAEKARDDPRSSSRNYRRSRSRSPPRRDSYAHNPFRDERRGDGRSNGRDRSISPPANATFSPGRSQPRARSPPKSEVNSEIITVESSTVGLIIGRGGENLRRVESETGARVQFMTGPEAGPKRQCRISGTPRQRADAIKDIMRVVEEHPSTVPETKAKPPSDTPRPGEHNIQVMVPDKTVGLIIGRGGETIRDIQERTGCHVNITSENKSINGLRPVNLIGSWSACEEAKRMINEVVESDTRGGAPNRAPAVQYPPQPQYGAPPPAYGMPYADPYGGGGGGGGYDPSGGSKSTDTIVVPSEAVGMVIGKGGETIKEMQSNSGCKINVSPPSGPDVNREIGLIGTRQAIDIAKRLIWDKREKQGGVWQRGSEAPQHHQAPHAQPYGDPYAQHTPAPYGQAPMQAAPPPADAADPYAAYGGYANYYALWAAAVANQPGR